MAHIPQEGSFEPDAAPKKSQSCEAGGGRSVFGMCLNWKVLVALAAVGLVVVVAAPGLAARALPLLLLAVCPLSMVAMMWAMRGTKTTPANQAGALEPTVSSVGAAGEAEPDLSELRSQLTAIHSQQERLTRRITELEAAGNQERGPESSTRETVLQPPAGGGS